MASERIVLITGASGALGHATATALGANGTKLALFDGPKAATRLDALAESLGRDRVVTHAGDLADAGTWTAALEAVRSKLGGAPTHAALIAGGWAGGAPVHEAQDDVAYDTMFTSNLDTVYRALRALLPPMVNARAGSLVVVGSRAAERPWTSAGAAAYAASKAAVLALISAVSEEVLGHGVRVNAILPSTLDTPSNRASMPKADPSKWVSLESAAGVIAFLLSDAARDISGASVPVYGRA